MAMLTLWRHLKECMEKVYAATYVEWRVACEEARKRREKLEGICTRAEAKKIEVELKLWDAEMERLHQKLNAAEYELLKLDEGIWRMESGEVLE
jgi:hypothetical protein